MSFADENLNALIQRIYDTALDDARWPSVIRDLARLINAEESLWFSPRLAENKHPL